MKRRELLKLLTGGKKPEDYYSKPGIDSVSKTFLHSIKDNIAHQQRKERFKNYTGYRQVY